MAGLIRREDVDAVREKARIEEIVGEHVTLKSAGVGSMKGLCPFHDERSPSFHVRPQLNLWHCFGCGEGGDVISFVQKIDHLGFAEAVEYLAGRTGITLRYEEGGGPRSGEEPGKRQRLVDAHRIAAEYYAEQLGSPEADTARAFLLERGFNADAAQGFGIGYAPKGWDHLLRHLRGKGFTEAELTATGLMSAGNRGQYDRFRGRLMWPIRDLTGTVVGFGARKLYEDDQGPKYLNTPETVLYKKSQVLYGIDLAKKSIAQTKQIVVVEGYTDVMAMHLSGVTTAVATCGTAFGVDHVRIARRLLGDTTAGGGVLLAGGDSLGGQVIFTFDGDAAGQKAALRAFGEEQRFFAQTFVAVDKEGRDPCEVRQTQGEAAVRDLIASRVPLFEFAIRSTLRQLDLNTVEGRVAGLRAAAPVVAGIRDSSMRPAYARELAGWLGMDVESVTRAVRDAGREAGRRRETRSADGTNGHPNGGHAGSGYSGGGDGHGGGAGSAGGPRSFGSHEGSGSGGGSDGVHPRDGESRADSITASINRRDPIARVEREALEVLLQLPDVVPSAEVDDLPGDTFTIPAYRVIHDAMRAAGGLISVGPGVPIGADALPDESPAASAARISWVERVREAAPQELDSLICELAVAPLPADRIEALGEYARGIVVRLFDVRALHDIADLRSRLGRMDAVAEADAYREAFTQLIALEEQRKRWRSSQ